MAIHHLNKHHRFVQTPCSKVNDLGPPDCKTTLIYIIDSELAWIRTYPPYTNNFCHATSWLDKDMQCVTEAHKILSILDTEKGKYINNKFMKLFSKISDTILVGSSMKWVQLWVLECQKLPHPKVGLYNVNATIVS